MLINLLSQDARDLSVTTVGTESHALLRDELLHIVPQGYPLGHRWIIVSWKLLANYFFSFPYLIIDYSWDFWIVGSRIQLVWFKFVQYWMRRWCPSSRVSHSLFKVIVKQTVSLGTSILNLCLWFAFIISKYMWLFHMEHLVRSIYWWVLCVYYLIN